MKNAIARAILRAGIAFAEFMLKVSYDIDGIKPEERQRLRNEIARMRGMLK